MGQRLIRSDILDSERVQTQAIEARWLFVTIMLEADDLGLIEINNFRLGRRAGIDQTIVPQLVMNLADADLIRVYEVDGKRFAFIPRFRQRLQIKRTKFPLPPAALMEDDKDAFNKINNLISNPPLSTVAQPSEPEPEPEEEKKIKRNTRPRSAPTAASKPASGQPDKVTEKDLIAQGVDTQVAKDWLKVRRNKKLPLTKTAWAGILKRIEDGGLSVAESIKHCAENGWAGFNISWVNNLTTGRLNNQTVIPFQTAKERDTAKAADWFRRNSGGLIDLSPPCETDSRTIDMETSNAPQLGKN